MYPYITTHQWEQSFRIPSREVSEIILHLKTQRWHHLTLHSIISGSAKLRFEKVTEKTGGTVNHRNFTHLISLDYPEKTTSICYAVEKHQLLELYWLIPCPALPSFLPGFPACQELLHRLVWTRFIWMTCVLCFRLEFAKLPCVLTSGHPFPFQGTWSLTPFPDDLS